MKEKSREIYPPEKKKQQQKAMKVLCDRITQLTLSVLYKLF